jgi:hypothetical protein
MYTALKKYAKRKAGCWGRVNHKRDMKAASKAVRNEFTQLTTETIEEYWKEYIKEEFLVRAAKQVMNDAWQEKLDELFESQLKVDFAADFDLITDEEPH